MRNQKDAVGMSKLQNEFIRNYIAAKYGFTDGSSGSSVGTIHNFLSLEGMGRGG